METNKCEINSFISGSRYLLLLATMVVLLFAGGCTGSRYNTQKNWHRTPASTGHNRCGCLLTPAKEHSIKLYRETLYVLQA